MTTSDDITRVLKNWDRDEDSSDQLLELVYDQLRAIAAARMRREDPGHTLQATALVHEAFVKLLSHDNQDWQDRGHFFRAAAESMRRILIDHARKKKSAKRGGEVAKTPINALDLATNYDPDRILGLDEALKKLEEEDPSAAEVVMLRFFGGLTVAETAEVMGSSERSVARDWSFARAQLYAFLSDDE